MVPKFLTAVAVSVVLFLGSTTTTTLTTTRTRTGIVGIAEAFRHCRTIARSARFSLPLAKQATAATTTTPASREYSRAAAVVVAALVNGDGNDDCSGDGGDGRFFAPRPPSERHPRMKPIARFDADADANVAFANDDDDVDALLEMAESVVPQYKLRNLLGRLSSGELDATSFSRELALLTAREASLRQAEQDALRREVNRGKYASLVGGILLGALFGLAGNALLAAGYGDEALDLIGVTGLEEDSLIDPYIDPFLLPVSLAAIGGKLSFRLGSVEGFPGSVVRKAVGDPVQSILLGNRGEGRGRGRGDDNDDLDAEEGYEQQEAKRALVRKGALLSLVVGAITGALLGFAVDLFVALSPDFDGTIEFDPAWLTADLDDGAARIEVDEDRYAFPAILAAALGASSYVLGSIEGFPGTVVRDKVGGPLDGLLKRLLPPDDLSDKVAKAEERNALRASSCVGGTMLGALAGLGVNLYAAMNDGIVELPLSDLPAIEVDPAIDPFAFPAAAAIGFGIVSYLLASIEFFPGTVVRSTLGRPVSSFVSKLTSAPRRGAEAVARKVDQAVAEAKAAQDKVAVGTKRAARKAARGTKKAIGDAVSLPGRKVEELSDKFKPQTPRTTEFFKNDNYDYDYNDTINNRNDDDDDDDDDYYYDFTPRKTQLPADDPLPPRRTTTTMRAAGDFTTRADGPSNIYQANSNQPLMAWVGAPKLASDVDKWMEPPPK